MPLCGIAQSTHPKDSTKVRQLDEIVVTADKVDTKLSGTGKSVIVITREQLDKSGGEDLAQILNNQPGIIVGGSGSNPGLSKSIYIQGATNGYALIMLDGIPVQDPSSTDNSFDLRLLNPDNIERIEIVKGSQSVLYGSDAIAGVINIITKKGGHTPLSLSAQESYGSLNTSQTGVSAGGSRGKWDYNADFTNYRTDGISEATDTVPGTFDPKDGYSEQTLHATLGWNPSGGIRIAPFFSYSYYNGNDDFGAFDIATNSTYTLQDLETGIRSQFPLGAGVLHFNYAYNQTHREDLEDSIPTLAYAGNFYSDYYTGYEHYLDAYVSYPLSKALVLVGGADYKHLNTGQGSLDLYPDFTIPGQVDTSASVLGSDSAHYQQLGVYGSAILHLGAFYLDGGLRYNLQSRYGDVLVYNFDPSYNVARRLKLFANLSSGYKSPSLYELYSVYGNKTLVPEKSMSQEAGLQYTQADGSFRIRGAFFERELQDVIFFSTNPTTYISQYINQNKENDKGFTLEVDWKPIPALSIRPYYTFVTGTVTDKSGAGGKDSTYFDLIRVPKNSAGASLGYQADPHWYVGGSVQWLDSRMDLYFNPVTNAEAPVTLKGYAVLNAYVEYKFFGGHLKVFIDGRNITNTQYTEIYGYNTLGATVTAGIRATL